MSPDEYVGPIIPSPPGHDPAPESQALSDGNYFIRHWRGRLSLAVSYWINGFLVNIIAVIIVLSVAVFAGRLANNYAVALALSGIWSGVIALSIWQMVGVWRSAARHMAITRRTGWARTAQVLVLVGALHTTVGFVGQGLPAIRDGFELASWLEENARWSFRVLRDGTELELSGGIGHGMSKELERFLDANPTISIVHVNLASGGLVEEAKRARNLIRARGLDTYTSNSCVSACTIVFMGGKARFLKTGGQLGFHAPQFIGLDGAVEQRALSEEKAYLTLVGVSPSFAARVVQTPHDDMWYPTGEELVEGGVVTAFTDGEDFAISGLDWVPDIESLDEELQYSRLYRALKARDPGVYQKLLDALHAAMESGQTMADLRYTSLPLIVPVYLRHLPGSSDESILRFTRLLLKELELLQDAPGRVCLDYLLGRGTWSANIAVKYFPPELREEELDVMADVLESAGRGRPLPSESESGPLIEAAMGRAREQVGGEISVFSRLADPEVDPAVACRVIRAVYSSVLSLPEEDASVALRGMYAGD